MQTLNDIATALGVSLQTVYNRKAEAEQRLGQRIEGSQHPTDKRKVVYDDQAVALITGQSAQLAKPTSDSVTYPVTVEVGNHATALSVPDVGSTKFSLETFRDTSVEALLIEDPEALANQILVVADQVMEGMDIDIAARRKRLKATQNAQEKVAEKVEDLKAKRKRYRHQARDLDAAQSSGAMALQDAVSTLQDLGKSGAGDAN